jgi:hypothetical protein
MPLGVPPDSYAWTKQKVSLIPRHSFHGEQLSGFLDLETDAYLFLWRTLVLQGRLEDPCRKGSGVAHPHELTRDLSKHLFCGSNPI